MFFHWGFAAARPLQALQWQSLTFAGDIQEPGNGVAPAVPLTVWYSVSDRGVFMTEAQALEQSRTAIGMPGEHLQTCDAHMRRGLPSVPCPDAASCTLQGGPSQLCRAVAVWRRTPAEGSS